MQNDEPHYYRHINSHIQYFAGWKYIINFVRLTDLSQSNNKFKLVIKKHTNSRKIFFMWP